MLSTNQIAGFFIKKYLKKEGNSDVYFWHADKHQTILQVQTNILGVHSQVCIENPNKPVSISLPYLHKSMGDEFFFFCL